MGEEALREIYDCFKKEQTIALATVEGDQPRLRFVTLLHHQNRFFIATGSENAKVEQIRRNPKVEFLLLVTKEGDTGSIRGESQASIVQDNAIKTVLFNEVEFMKRFWESPEDPALTLIELRPTAYQYMKPGEYHE